MREIKFRALDPLSSRWVYYGTSITGTVDHLQLNRKTESQYTGIKDRNGTEVYEGDLLNIFYTSKDGYNFDGVYKVSMPPSGVHFEFIKLLWESEAHNQNPYQRAEVSHLGFIRRDYKKSLKDYMLCVSESGKWNYSDYFEVIGNIYENPDLMEVGE